MSSDTVRTDEAFLPAPRTYLLAILRDVNFHVRHIHTNQDGNGDTEPEHKNRETEGHDTGNDRNDCNQFQHREDTAAHFGQNVLRRGDGVLDGLQHDLDFQYSFR